MHYEGAGLKGWLACLATSTDLTDWTVHENGNEFTDAIWVYWTHDLNHWNPAHKAVVLDGKNCTRSHKCIGLPSAVKVGNRLAVFYDAPGGESTSHMNRDVGLAWLDLPLDVSGAEASNTFNSSKP